jgi:hypothetical protein
MVGAAAAGTAAGSLIKFSIKLPPPFNNKCANDYSRPDKGKDSNSTQ